MYGNSTYKHDVQVHTFSFGADHVINLVGYVTCIPPPPPPPPGSNFVDLQREFMDKHYHHFEDKEENHLIYTDIFQRYVREVA